MKLFLSICVIDNHFIKSEKNVKVKLFSIKVK